MNISISLKYLFPIIITLILIANYAEAYNEKILDARLERASKHFNSVMSTSQSRILSDSLRQARGIIILRAFKVGYIVAVKGAEGVALVRDEVTGSWSAPVFITSGEGSIGLQAGGKRTDSVILLMNEQSLSILDKSRFQIGLDVAASAGGFGGEADTTIGRAPIVVYNNVDGIFAGISIDGGYLKSDKRANATYHNKRKIKVREILFEDKGRKTQAARDLINLIEKNTIADN
jgi:lipid-binding SYLF domain-containing protein